MALFVLFFTHYSYKPKFFHIRTPFTWSIIHQKIERERERERDSSLMNSVLASKQVSCHVSCLFSHVWSCIDRTWEPLPLGFSLNLVAFSFLSNCTLPILLSLKAWWLTLVSSNRAKCQMPLGKLQSETEHFSLFLFSCWIEESKYTWILQGPVVISMVLNFFFLVNIVRVLVTKLRETSSISHSSAVDTHQIRKAVRATLILIPLLGLQYVLTPFRPPPGSPGENVYEVLAAIFTSFQGLAVALLFCFFNGEVINVLKKCLLDSCSHRIGSINAYSTNHSMLPPHTTNNNSTTVATTLRSSNTTTASGDTATGTGGGGGGGGGGANSAGDNGHKRYSSGLSCKYSPPTTQSTVVWTDCVRMMSNKSNSILT